VINGVDSRLDQVSPFLPNPFPVAEYHQIFLDADEPTIVPDQGAYGSGDIGQAAWTSSGRGDSVCVSYRTARVGPSGRGRNFVPFLAREAVSTDGLIDGTVRVAMDLWFGRIMMGEGDGVLATSAVMSVYSKVSPAGFAPIISHAVSQVPSRLRSRTK